MRRTRERPLVGRQTFGDQRFDAREQFAALVDFIEGGFDRSAEANGDVARLHGPVPFSQEVLRADERNRNNGNAGLNRHEERAFFERAQSSIEASRAFRKHDERKAVFQFLKRIVHAFGGLLAVGAIQRNKSRLAHAERKNRNAEKFLLGDHGQAARNCGKQRDRIHIGNVVRSKNASARRDIFEAFNMDTNPDDARDDADAGHGEAVHQAGVSRQCAPQNQQGQEQDNG